MLLSFRENISIFLEQENRSIVHHKIVHLVLILNKIPKKILQYISRKWKKSSSARKETSLTAVAVQKLRNSWACIEAFSCRPLYEIRDICKQTAPSPASQADNAPSSACTGSFLLTASIVSWDTSRHLTPLCCLSDFLRDTRHSSHW